jgi:hypothetical protein
MDFACTHTPLPCHTGVLSTGGSRVGAPKVADRDPVAELVEDVGGAIGWGDMGRHEGRLS